MTQAYVFHRFTLDELEGFLETAKECIPGVKEAVVAANSHKAHQVIHPYAMDLCRLCTCPEYPAFSVVQLSIIRIACTNMIVWTLTCYMARRACPVLTLMCLTKL